MPSTVGLWAAGFAEALLDAVDRAIDTFRNKARWKFLRDNAMRSDFSWEVSARKYLELYQNILAS